MDEAEQPSLNSEGEHHGDPAVDGNDDVGPDPIWSVGLFAIGLLIMAIGGAGTWHWTFNIGSAILLLGATTFLLSTAVTSLKQSPIDLNSLVRALQFWREDDDRGEDDDNVEDDAEGDDGT